MPTSFFLIGRAERPIDPEAPWRPTKPKLFKEQRPNRTFRRAVKKNAEEEPCSETDNKRNAKAKRDKVDGSPQMIGHPPAPVRRAMVITSGSKFPNIENARQLFPLKTKRKNVLLAPFKLVLFFLVSQTDLCFSG